MGRKLVVIAPPGSSVPHYDRMNHLVRSFLTPGEPTEVEFGQHWLKELRAGCVKPGDAETARLAGIELPKKASK